jgi:HK97 family phage prohead protease
MPDTMWAPAIHRPSPIVRAFAPALRDTGLPAGVIGQVSGIALVYDTLDSYGTTFAKGSLDRTRREKVATRKVKLFWDHGDALIQEGMYDSDLHIGTVRSLEDITLPDGRRAAYMMADLLDTPKAREVKQYLASVLASGGETGLSVGFRPRSETKIKGGGIRFDEIELREISITSMQSVPGSAVLAVRQQPRGRVYATMADRLLALRRVSPRVATMAERMHAVRESYRRGPWATMADRRQAVRESYRRGAA